MHPQHAKRRAGAHASGWSLLCALLLLGSATGGHAQAIRGRVVEEGLGTGLPGAVVTVLDAQGNRVRGVLTNEQGWFSVRVAAGTYRLRAEMIGRRTVESGPIEVGEEDAATELAMPVEAIQLADLQVGTARRCSLPGEVARATHVVWEEAQKALRAESITREASLYRFDLVEYRRRLDGKGEKVLADEVDRQSKVVENPFSTLPPDELARDGYARDEADGTYLYAPDTDVLLSPGFQATHCFALRRDGTRPGMIGLVFRPAPGRRQTDIEGVMWLAESSAELRSLEFRYRNVPRSLLRGDYTGFAEFQRLPGGAWIIRRWWLRSPLEGRRGRVTAVQEEAGEVLRVEAVVPVRVSR